MQHAGAAVASIHMLFNSIISTLILELAAFSEINLDKEEKEREELVHSCFCAVYHSVEITGVKGMINIIGSKCTHGKVLVRKEAYWSY